MEIFVKRDDEKTIILREVQLTHTGHQLKMKIFHRTGILPKKPAFILVWEDN